MKQVYKGKLTLRIEKESPYYHTYGRKLEKVLVKNLFGYSVSLWTVQKDGEYGEFSDWAKAHLCKIFGDSCVIDKDKVRSGNNVYYTADMKWLFNSNYQFKSTDHWKVLFDVKSQKYVGYSHRACCGFGIGDMLFTEKLTKEEEWQLCLDRKNQWRYLKWLIRHYIRKDAVNFADLTILGIMDVVPFRDKGSKRIENLQEAYQAALNFANYVS